MMNQKKILVCLAALCGMFMILLLNDDSYIMELTFSKDSGFYSEPFELELYAPEGTEIFYTLDGSDPDENAIKYTKPIKITDATEKENIYSTRKDVSAGFLSDYIATYSTSDPGYVVPNYNVDKCTVVKGIYKDKDGNISKIKTKSYFVDYEDKKGYDNLYIVSVVTDPNNLFDTESGIYVLGNIFEERIYENYDYFLEEPYWWWWEANYHQRGREWERSADIQLFDTERKLCIDKNCGIRIQGGGSRGKTPKSLNIYARKEYDNEGRFFLDLFNTGYMADTITLFAGGDDSTAKIKDMLMSGLVKNRNFAVMNYVPCALFLDGEYWGVYWITEKYNDSFFSYYYDTTKENVIMIKAKELAEGTDDDYNLYTEMMDFMSNTDLSEEMNYKHACELIDMQSYIDYYAAEIYIGRYNDWPGGNEALWRVRNVENSQNGDGRWRWILYDVNSGGLSSGLTETDTFESTMDRSDMFYNLCQNEEFKKTFATTFMDLANTSFLSENTDAVIGQYISLMLEPMQMHRKRFFGSEDSSSIMAALADIKIFFDNRRPYIVEYLKKDLELEGELATVELEINDVSSGKIALNTIEPALGEDGNWKGEYYTDFPITLTAVANDGYKFVGWEISNSQKKEIIKDETIKIYLSENRNTIRAIYEEAGE